MAAECITTIIIIITTTDGIWATATSVLSPNCLQLCLTVGKAIRRLKDTSKS
jgi:hypothetical protein